MVGFLQPRRALVPAGVVVVLCALAAAFFERPIDTRRIYRIGTRGASFSPNTTPDGRLDGLGVDVVSEAARRAGIRLEWVDSPEGPDQALASQRVELWPLLTVLPERTRSLYISDPWIISERCLITRGSPPTVWKGVPVAYGLGPLSLITGNLPGAQPVYQNNEVSAIQSVCQNRAAAAFVSVHSLGALLLRRPEGCETATFVITSLPSTNLKAGIGSSRQAAPVADLLRSQIGNMALDGALTALFHKRALFSGSENEVIYAVVNARRRTRLLIYASAGLGLVLAVLLWQMRRVRESRRAAEQANLAKSQFLANMSHEIRTPLNGIAGMVEVLARSDLNTDQREMVNIIQQSSESLVTIVNDVLDLSKIDAGAMQVEEVAFDLRGTVEGVAKLLSPLAKSKGLAFESVFSPEVPRNTKGDPLRIRQVLLNLVANAIKFTEKGKIRIEVLTGGDQSAGTAILFRVIDSGIGINPQIVNRLFDPFTQADAGTTRKYGGTGLGLAISRRLVMLMGGSIGVESTPGEGSTFWFVIPIEATPDASRDQAPTESLPIASPDAPANITLQPADVLPALPVPSMPGRILIVDDNPVNQLVAVRAVNNIGYDTCTAAGGEAALEAIETTRFDLILMDCQMPGMDGFQHT